MTHGSTPSISGLLDTSLPPTRATLGSDTRTLRFVSAMLFVTLILQRFAVPLGSKPFSLVGALGLLVAAGALARGTLALHRTRLVAFMALALCMMAGLTWHALHPDGLEANLPSLFQFLLLTAFATLTFAEPVDEQQFFRVVNRWLAFIAVAGAVQFIAQFVGVKIFAFTGLLPDSLLYEFGYNLQIPTGIGELFKSNGMFLIEPSVFSQFMAVAFIIETLAFRRPAYLALFIAGLLLSFSGTGWIVLAAFVLAAALGMGWRGLAIAAATIVLLGAVLGVVALAAPDVASSLQARFGEFSQPGTSGHQRFITPFWVLDDALKAEPLASVFGLGSGVSERLSLPYTYDVNTPIKVALDYGFPALLAYVLTFVVGRRSPVQAGLLFPAMVLFFFTGGYQQFPPVLFFILLLTSVAQLQPASAADRA